jgi:hypothetical protein
MVNYYTSILLPDPAVSISLYPEIIISFLHLLPPPVKIRGGRVGL